MAANEERARVVAYIREALIKDPCDEFEEHMNDVLNRLASDIENGAHVRNQNHG